MSDAGQLAMFLAIGAGLVSLLTGPVGMAIAQRLGRRDDTADARLVEVETRVAELEGQVQGMQELSERVDFAERLLAQQREQPHRAGLPGDVA